MAVDKMCLRRAQIVAYDMGLGKTVLTIAAIERLMDAGTITEPGLIIALSTLKYQWAEQIQRFTEGTSVSLVIDGTPTKRTEQYGLARNWYTSGVDYIILNYEQVVNDWNQVRKLPRGFIVLDEATAIKGFRAKRSKYVKKLTSPLRFALTGTPMENGKPEEIYSIMQFIEPSVLGGPRTFDDRYIVRNSFGGVSRYRNLPELHDRLSPWIVRKRQTDADVAPYLPVSTVKAPVRVFWDRAGARLYGIMRDDLSLDLLSAAAAGVPDFNVYAHYGEGRSSSAGKLQGRIGAKILAMRMLCCSPELLHSSNSAYVRHLRQAGALDGLTKSPKLMALQQYVSEFATQSPANKIVIFTHFVEMTALIAKALVRYQPQVYTGAMNARQKEAAKVRFQTDLAVRVLVSSDAGGYGVDLPQANLLINYDLPDTAGMAKQRNDRIKRASSTWPTIVVQDFVMHDSIEERQVDVLRQKTSIQDAVLDGVEGQNFSLTVSSLRKFLTTRV